MIRALAVTIACAAAYGYALGAAHSELYAARNLLKLPALLLVTAAVASLSYWIAARASGAALTFGEVQRVTWRLFQDASVMLASLAPVVFFQARLLRARDDGELGGYDSFLAFNVLAVALSGALALVLQSRRLLREHGVPSARAGALVGAWLALSLLVGGQAAFYMRPFVGFPATRGFTPPPFFLGAQPDLRGATSFYEMVLQTLARPPLPPELRKD